jgi:hypothetical protein
MVTRRAYASRLRGQLSATLGVTTYPKVRLDARIH